MTNQNPPANQATLYQICLRGQLNQAWAEWFEGMQIAIDANGDTLLVGTIVDQAALYGLIKKFRDLGMQLISIMPVETTN